MIFFLSDYLGDGKTFLVLMLSYILVIVLSLSLHEFAHAFAAYKSGDSTPKMTGRLTLNPVKHMDIMGMICCALFGFGWAKPVQINPTNFRNIKKGTIWTSLAGVLMNFALSFIGYGLYSLTLLIPQSNFLVDFIQLFTYYLFFINLCLGVFNFLPIYPLDGFKLVEALTSYNNKFVQFMYRYGNLILILFVVFCDTILIKLINFVSYPIIWFWNLIF